TRSLPAVPPPGREGGAGRPPGWQGGGGRATPTHTRSLPFLRVPREPPPRRVVARQQLAGEPRAHHPDGHAAALEDGVVELAGAHAPGLDQLLVQRADLEAADHVGGLVEGWVGADEGAANLGLGVRALVADALDEQLDGLLGRHGAEVDAE